MKIAMMVRGYLTVPRPADMIYAPLDLAVAIAEGLVGRGHKVDFFAPLGSGPIGVPIESCNLRPLARDQQEFRALIEDLEKMNHYVPGLWDRYMVDEMFKRAHAGEYDLLHFHHAEAALPHAMGNTQVPVAYTLHDPIYGWYKELFELYESPNQRYISISNNQRRDAPDLNYAGTVYNSTNTDLWPFGEEAEDYLLIAGRIVPEKGIKEAIQVAQATDHRLLIIGPVYPDNQGYFDQYIKPYLNDKILYLGYMEQEQLACYYKKAKAFLMPIQWEEPFGLTMIEAMACGTPVIALRRGAVQEVVADGKTGFVVDSITEMIEAVQKIDTINRADCREHVLQNFSLEKMVDAYEATFEKILSKRKKLTRVKNKIRSVPSAVKKVAKKARKTQPVG
ncbi:MAG: glycosyltransferase family 4 protein [Candidatus Saccharimonadales bacterium]